jgi:hypothetical protein
MAYTPKWTKLGDALAYVVSTGVPELQAKTELCQAIADRALMKRVRIAESDHLFGGMFIETELQVAMPAELFPEDFDWSASRPIGKWLAGPSTNSEDWRPRDIGYIEVNAAQMRDIWSDPEPRSTERPQPQKHRPAPVASLRTWYGIRVRTWPSTEYPPSAERDLIDAREAFPKHTVTREIIRAVRAELAPPEWTAGGRPRKLAPK